jgi:carboxylesterase type B
MSVGALLGAPAARSLFQRAILQSGAADHVLQPAEAEEVAQVFLEELGGPAATPEALARLGAEQLLAAQNRVLRRLGDLARLMVFLPAVDGDVLPEAPLRAVARGATAGIPLLIGTTLDEWKLFTVVESALPGLREAQLLSRLEEVLPRVAAAAPEAAAAAAAYREALRARGGRTTPFEVWSAFQSGRVFHYPASKLAEAHARAGGSAYGYLFTWRTPFLRRALGAFHALDVPFVFGLGRSPLFRSLGSLAGSAGRLASAMQEAWTGFARCGDPGHRELPAWPRYEPAQRATMVLGRQCALVHTPLEEERRLWQDWSRGAPPAP